MQQRVNRKVCFIGGAGHSGSTLLGLILGSHPLGFYGGEIKKADLAASGSSRQKGVCRRCGPACDVWGGLAALHAPDIYEALSRRTGKPLIIDSAKNTEWIGQQLDHLAGSAARPYLIFLQRDGRAVINSRLRKYSETEVATHIQEWKERIEATIRLFERFEGAKTVVRYEALASQPEAEVRRLCDFLEIPYEPTMLDYERGEHHTIAANLGTQFLVARAQDQAAPYVRLSARNEAYYANHPPGIHLDLRWQQELPAEARELFDRMAGTLNAPFGWEG